MRRARRTAAPPAAAALAALLLAAGGSAGAEERLIEGIGAVPVKGARAPRSGTPRDAALREAIAEAVRQVALELLPHLDPAAAEPSVDAALGRDLRSFANRFRIVEDRGEGPAQLVDEPGVLTEYVMVVHAQVDVGRVRRSLEAAGLLAPPPSEGGTRQRVRVVIEDMDGWAGYNAVRTLLGDLGARDALPVELERGRAVLEVETGLAPEDLLASLVRSAPPELRVEAIASDAASITLRAHFVSPLGGPAP